MLRTSPRLRTPLRAAMLVFLALFVLLPVSRAHAESIVGSMVVNGSLAPDGTLVVTEELTFEGGAPSELTQRVATTENAMDGVVYNFAVSDVSATAAGAEVDLSESADRGYHTITVKPGGAEKVTISYTVKGAARSTATGQTTVSWRFLQGLSLPVKKVTGTVDVPALPNYVDCWAGAPSAPAKCSMYTSATHDSQDPTFTDGPRGAGEIVRMEVRFPSAAVAPNEVITHRWSLDRAFSVGPLPLGLALGALLLGGLALWSLHRRAGRDAVGDAEPLRVAEFHPVAAGESEFNVIGGVRPGHVGTLVDERVDPVDVTATLLDLAVRGHLLITELPRESSFDTREWTFTRRTEGDELRPFESSLLDAVAPADGTAVRASDLPSRVGEAIPAVQSALYDEMVHRGWYQRRPDDTRSSWGRMAWIALVVAVLATVALAAFTTFGLLGLALIAIALGLLFVAQEMPARTHEGAGVLSGLMALRSELLSRPTDQMPQGREYEELSQVLPYAVVLGGRERWLAALVAADDDEGVADSSDLSWYHAPADWHMKDLPNSLNSFVTHVQGLLFTR